MLKFQGPSGLGGVVCLHGAVQFVALISMELVGEKVMTPNY